jgi:hypothetical protein
MLKTKLCVSSVIILSILFGLLAPMSAVVVEDFSGDWSGRYHSITYQMNGNLYIRLTQNGTSIGGTFTLIGAICGAIENWTLNGKVTGNILSFEASGNCGGRNILFKASQGVLTENTISGSWTTYEEGAWHGEATYNVTRSINYINTTAGTGGAIVPSGNVSVPAGTDQTFNILPDNGYKILNVVVDGVSIGAKNSYTFYDVSANHTIMATFKTAPNNFIINVTAGSGGTISPVGNVSVTAGTNITFNILPEDGYKLLDVIVDGVSIGAEASYTFTNVSANHMIMATFKALPNPTGSIVPSILTPLLLNDE